MAQAWSRCLGDPRRSVTPEAESGASGLPFTASLYFDSKLTDAGVRHLGSDTFEGLAEAVTSEVTVAAILERAGELTMLHACGVADPEWRCHCPGGKIRHRQNHGFLAACPDLRLYN